MNPTPPTVKSSCSDRELDLAIMEFVTKEAWRTPAGGIDMDYEINYSTDANCVLPLLEKEHQVYVQFDAVQARWLVKTEVYGADATHWGTAPTFCRAACFALLRAHGVEVTE